MKTSIRSAEEAREAMNAAGISVSAWAKAHGFKPSTVAAVLRGDRPARIGESHKVAVTLRLKAGVTDINPQDV